MKTLHELSLITKRLLESSKSGGVLETVEHEMTGERIGHIRGMGMGVFKAVHEASGKEYSTDSRKDAREWLHTTHDETE